MTKSISPTEVRFIKLGRGGEWERSSIETDQVLRLGYRSPLHQACLAGKWDTLLRHWVRERGGKTGVATSDVRQIRDFYERPSTALWFTFYGRLLWWCFAQRKVEILDDQSRVRAVKGKWQSADLAGRPLSIDTLDGRLTRIGAYRGTICDVSATVAEYLVRRINGLVAPEVRSAQDALLQLQLAVEALIKGLFWKDFELLADLMFSRAGYQRVDVLGKTAKAIDLDLISPVTRRRAFVQVKSESNTSMLEDSIAQFKDMPQYSEFFFICHSGDRVAEYRPEDPNIHVLTGAALAQLVIHAGLTEWLVGKRS